MKTQYHNIGPQRLSKISVIIKTTNGILMVLLVLFVLLVNSSLSVLSQSLVTNILSCNISKDQKDIENLLLSLHIQGIKRGISTFYILTIFPVKKYLNRKIGLIIFFVLL